MGDGETKQKFTEAKRGGGKRRKEEEIEEQEKGTSAEGKA